MFTNLLINKDARKNGFVEILTRVADPDGCASSWGAGSGSSLERKAGSGGSALKSKFRIFRSRKWSRGQLWTLTMEAWRLKMDPRRACTPMVAGLHHFDADAHWSKKPDLNPDPHQSEKIDLNPCQGVMQIRSPYLKNWEWLWRRESLKSVWIQTLNFLILLNENPK